MRNENGFGTVVCLDKTGKKRRKPWAVRVTVGWSPEGKQKCKYLGYYPTKKEATLALSQYHLQGLDVNINSVTFKDIFESWKKKQEGVLTEKNLAAYENCFNQMPTLHDKKLKDIKATHLQLVMDELSERYKVATLTKTRSLIGQLYKHAMENDLAIKNYAEFLVIKKEQEEVGSPFTKATITHLWSLSGKEEVVDDILLLIYLGTRISETLAIKTEHIHLEDRYIEIHGTKTKAAERIVPIHDDIVPLIEKRLNRKFLIERDNKPSKYTQFQPQFTKLMERMGYDHKIHDCRKTLITYMFEAGVTMENIKFIVGHAQSGVTASVYVKVKHNAQLFVSEINKMKLK